MAQHYSTVFSNQQEITARGCPRGVIALSIGHASLAGRAADFPRLAQVVRNTELHFCRRRKERLGEQHY
jgi:hypothetical protein